MNYQKMTKKQLIDMLILKESPKTVRNPNDVFEALQEFWDTEQENFVVMVLDATHNIKAKRLVSKGTINRCLVHPREVYAPAIELRAASIIVAHNHPSGNIEPSQEDYEVTDRLNKAGEVLGIKLVDSLVFSNTGWYSMMGTSEV